jgi:hypothetical protein
LVSLALPDGSDSSGSLQSFYPGGAQEWKSPSFLDGQVNRWPLHRPARAGPRGCGAQKPAEKSLGLVRPGSQRMDRRRAGAANPPGPHAIPRHPAMGGSGGAEPGCRGSPGVEMDCSGLYSSSSAYLAMFVGQSSILGAKELWKTKAPGKCRFFFWSVLHGRSWTAGMLLRHGLRDNDLCALCSQGPETLDHLLAGCMFSREFWFEFLRQFSWQ